MLEWSAFIGTEDAEAADKLCTVTDVNKEACEVGYSRMPVQWGFISLDSVKLNVETVQISYGNIFFNIVNILFP